MNKILVGFDLFSLVQSSEILNILLNNFVNANIAVSLYIFQSRA